MQVSFVPSETDIFHLAPTANVIKDSMLFFEFSLFSIPPSNFQHVFVWYAGCCNGSLQGFLFPRVLLLSSLCSSMLICFRLLMRIQHSQKSILCHLLTRVQHFWILILGIECSKSDLRPLSGTLESAKLLSWLTFVNPIGISLRCVSALSQAVWVTRFLFSVSIGQLSLIW
jgi:hypothetical protein